MHNVDLAVIGGGPAGLAAALAARRNGVDNILIIERDKELGGILQQCIHNGFGLHYFGEELTGPEYAERFIEMVREENIPYKTNTMVLDIQADRTITAVNSREGLLKIRAQAVILAMGCRERTRGAINIPGDRPAGIFTAGCAQRFVNMEGYLPGKKAVILGSGDIGLIMARRLTLEGVEVKMVCELMPYSGGLTRNIVQCLEDFNIPLKLSHTVVNIHGKDRLEGVTIAAVDENLQPIEGSEEYVECDTLLLSVGLIPENELSRGVGIALDPVTSGPVVDETMATSVEGIYACGNVVHVHDLVDYVTRESETAGYHAAEFIKNNNGASGSEVHRTIPGKGVRYIVPQRISNNSLLKGFKIFFRSDKVYVNARIAVRCGRQVLHSVKRQKISPGEMEILDLKPSHLENIEVSSLAENGLTIELEY
ncbi:MAG: FAD-dependent oxidoreductase [Clostridiales bacterium]|jgi:NADPH-dependent 2,4-dienoyl-CoA reductase/sulfur reductase-like enzyme|nr:FAD-dependent oxidoreductase [Clostridiales bacterium]